MQPDDELYPDANIMRHERPVGDREFSHGDADLIDAVSAHLTQHIGPIDSVFHEIISEHVHVDVHLMRATPERPWHVLATTGMAEKPMTTPEGIPDDFRHAELMISLPASWDLSEAAMKDESFYWPVRWLKVLARLPHEYTTWLGDGHTVPNGDPAEPFASNTKLTGMMVLPCMELEPESMQLTLSDGRTIRFWSLLPLHTDEMEYKLKKGADALLDLFDEAGVSAVVDPDRPSVIPAKRWWQF